MLNIVIIAAILGQYIAYELLVQIVAIASPRSLVTFIDTIQHRAVHKVFSILECWRGWKPILEDRLGQELPERFIFIANHQSLFDIPILWKLLPRRHRIRFIAKRELRFGFPLVSTCLRLQGHALISRDGNFTQAMQNLARFSKRCKTGGFCPVLFPEGTRSRDGQLGPFHTAGFRKIVEGDPLPVVVAAIDGGSRVASMSDMIKNLGRYRYTVRLAAVLPPPQGKKEILAALQLGRSIVEKTLADMRAETDPQHVATGARLAIGSILP